MSKVWNSSSDKVHIDTIKILMGGWIIKSAWHLKNCVCVVCSLMLAKSHPVGPSMRKKIKRSRKWKWACIWDSVSNFWMRHSILIHTYYTAQNFDPYWERNVAKLLSGVKWVAHNRYKKQVIQSSTCGLYRSLFSMSSSLIKMQI